MQVALPVMHGELRVWQEEQKALLVMQATLCVRQGKMEGITRIVGSITRMTGITHNV